jgi:uncharacterized protein YceK
LRNIILTLAAASILMGCAAASVNTVPEGKTENDQTAAEEYCQEKANLHTGFWAFNNAWYIYDNFRAREEYRKCLIETGWIAEGQTQAPK